jgi:hypothetical protein
MSSNRDLVRSIFAATERSELLQPAEWVRPGDRVDYLRWTRGRKLDGVAGMAESLGNRLSAWDELRILGRNTASWMTSAS